MFENEIKEINEKLKRTLKEYKKIKKLYDYIYQLEDYRSGIIFDTGFSLKDDYYIYQQVNRALKSLVHSKISYYFNCNISENGTAESFKENALKVKKISNEDIINQLKKYLEPNCYKKESKVFINKNIIELHLGEYCIPLLLHVLNIFENNKIEEKEIIEKAEKTLKESNTFIYRNIKITVYKNGKMKLVFNNEKVLKSFIEFSSDITK